MKTRNEYLQKAQEELGEKEYKNLSHSIDNEYYLLIENSVKAGNKISQEVYDSLSEGQKYHFNKHYNHRNDKIYN